MTRHRLQLPAFRSIGSQAGLIAACLSACLPGIGPRESLVDGPRILAVIAEPPEAAPGEEVSYQVLVVTKDGTATDASVSWEFCAAPKPLGENAPVSEACLGDAVVPIGASIAPVKALTPLDACAVFGPDTPPGGFRPRDPDATGGYFLPLRLGAFDLVAFGLERIRCNLANAPIEAAQEFASGYVPNRNPKQLPLRLTMAGTDTALGAIPAGASVALEVGWNAAEAEGYLAYEPNLQRVVSRREALAVAWFVTAGSVDSDVTGRTESDAGTNATNVWHAPTAPGVVHLWTVLRDSRGGSSAASYELVVSAP